MLDPLPNSVLPGSLEELLPIIMWSPQKNPPPISPPPPLPAMTGPQQHSKAILVKHCTAIIVSLDLKLDANLSSFKYDIY